MTETPPVREASTTRVPAARRASPEPSGPSLPGHLARVALGAAAATAAVLGGVVGAGVVPLAAPGGASLAFGAVPDLPSPGRTATDVVDGTARAPVTDLEDATTRSTPRSTSPRAEPAPSRRAVPSTPPRLPVAVPPRLPVTPPPARPTPGTPVDTPDRPTPTSPDGPPSSTPGTTPGTPPTTDGPSRGGGRDQGGGREQGGNGGRGGGDRTGDGRPGAGRPAGADAPASSPAPGPQGRISASG